MTTTHLLDNEIQQYALEKAGCDKYIKDHMQICESCREKAESYLLIFSDIQTQPRPTFEFKLSDLVMQQLPQTKAKASGFNLLIFLMVFAGLLMAGSFIYFFWSYLISVFTIDSPMLIWLFITMTIGLVLFLGSDIYSKYTRQMKVLNFS